MSAAHCTLSTNQSCEKTARNPLAGFLLSAHRTATQMRSTDSLVRTLCPASCPQHSSPAAQISRLLESSETQTKLPRFILNNCSSPLVASRNGNDGNMLLTNVQQMMATTNGNSISHLVEVVVVDIAVKVVTNGGDRVNWISFNSTSQY